MPAFSAIDVIRCARHIVADGGDTDPCELGAYCLRCCLSIAKGDLDRRHGARLDQVLIDARDRVAKHDKGIAHTRESALALLDAVLAEGPHG